MKNYFSILFILLLHVPAQAAIITVPAGDAATVTTGQVRTTINNNFSSLQAEVDLNTAKVTNTDDQTIDSLSLDGTTLSISLEDDGEAVQTVDLSGLQDGTGTDDQVASEVSTVTTNFDGNLSASDTTVQAALETLDEMSGGGTTLTDEASLYTALSDVSQFYEPGDTIQTASSTTLPGTCTTGETYIDTDADTNGELYICVATDTWKAVDDDGGAGGMAEIVEDTSPQLGGNLDIQTYNIEGIDATEFGYLDGVTEDIQTALDSIPTDTGDLTNGAGFITSETDDQTAAEVSISDAGGIITATDVEGALQENRAAIDLNTAKTTMTYPGAGIPVSTGSAWGTSYSLATLKTAMTLDLDDNYTWTGTHSFTGTVNLPSSVTLPNDSVGANQLADGDLGDISISSGAVTVETVGGATITRTIASGTSSLGTSSISDGACATVVTTSATGAATTDIINWTFNADPTSTTGYNPAGDLLYIVAYPTANNVNFKVCNKSGSAVTPGAVTLNWRVQR